MRRKVVQIAGFTKVVSLPSEWVKKNKIEKGDELDVSERGTFLLVTTINNQEQVKRAHIDASKIDTRTIWPLISLIHKTGYHEIKLVGISKKVMQTIHEKVSSSLLGFEVIEQTNDYCLIKNIAEGMPTNFNSILRKIFLVTTSQARQCLEFISKNDNYAMNEVIKLEQTNDKLTNFSERLLNDEAITLENRYEYFIVWLLENIGDGYKLICKDLSEVKTLKIDKEVLEAFNQVNNSLEEFYKLFYKFNLQDFSSFSEKLDKTTEELKRLLLLKKGNNSVILSHLSYITRTLHDSVGALVFLKADFEGKLS